MDIQAIYHLFRLFPSVVTDTRKISPGSLFFALKGEQFDGNQFAAEALEKGARYAVVDDPTVVENERFLLVKDTLATLQELARLHRSTLNIPVIGLTGTNGKTTTKELIREVLSQKFKVLATPGNLNNHIGVPLTLLKITYDVEIAIIEMGANHVGEIGMLCELARPTHGLITNIGKAHLEGFGSFEGVKRGKAELYDYLSAHEGELFLRGDNPILCELAVERFGAGDAARVRTHRYGMSGAHFLNGEVRSADPFLELSWRESDGTGHVVQTQLAGTYNLENVLAAVAVGWHFGVSPEQINHALAHYRPNNNRSQVIDTARGNRVIGDYYNANASSMEVALKSFSALGDPRPKVLILGDMFEMGETSAAEHAAVVRMAMEVGAAKIIFVGRAFYAAREHAAEARVPGHASETRFFETIAAAKTFLSSTPVEGAVILVKGSRGIAMEGLMDVL